MFYSVGAIAASFLITRVSKTERYDRSFVVTALLTGGLIIAMSMTVKYFIVYLIFMMLSSFFINIFQIRVVTCLQSISTAIDRGAVFSKMEIYTNITLPVGMVIWGLVSDIISIKYSLVLSGIGLFIVGVKAAVRPSGTAADKGHSDVL